VLEALAADPALSAWQGLGFVVQAYQKRCPFVIAWLIELARRTGRRLMIRLVKGAYWDSEVKRTQVDGLSDYPVFTRKAHTDLCYLACAARMLAAPAEIYAQFATHNAHTLASVAQMARERSNEDYEFQCLYGMGEPLYDNVVGAGGLGRRCRIYAPVGSHDTLLPYLVRRLLENGANASFVNRVVDENVGVEELIEDPLDAVGRTGGGCHPAIPLPRALYGERVNSAGVDLCDEPTIAALEDALDRSSDTVWHAAPLVPGALTPAGEARQIVNPADRSKPVGTVIDANAETIEQALANAAACASRWAQTPPSVRAAALERAADLLQSRRLQFVSLCLREAGKTWSGAIAEVREAIDYCRYYAWRLAHCDWSVADAAPGPAVCISPWNFPLAIFVGEVSAALAAGSPVIAKPAEQTPLIAHLAVQLLRRAGIPAQVLQFVPGPGETVGARLVADARVKSVIFTGSCEVAHRIDRSIAGRPGVRLIAETGGINAMIVDSSALPEQVVQDVLSSGFDSAGQRCSALRVLCLQDDIAERTIVMLRAAMRELAIGDPARLSTDIGPIIDPEAHARIEAHIERMRTLGHGVFQPQLPAACARGCYLPPTLIEIASFAQLQHEVFGPVVHVLRFDAERLPQLVDDINASGYGLTLGIQSRIDETVELVTARARVGNIYVNRSMIGAVVGVQPFGGEGRSGTGPKAGGPLYLYRLAGADRVTPAMIGAPAVADLAAQPVALRELSQWAVASGRAELAALCDDYGAQSLLQARLDLPGPTGERNTLHFAPRGCLLCSAVDAPALLHQLAAVFASGNRAAVVDTPQSNAVLVQLPSELAAAIDRRAPADHAGLAGVLSEVDDAALARRLAALPGSSIPLICPHPRSRRYPLYRMLVERVVSVNTTAAGGNAALMAMPA
jgi:RHH-type proline utilization regulon transcriptional repressor/proline dehydrogenase/delta 1-pyrroline-5-carboxylate dehydrogenase